MSSPLKRLERRFSTTRLLRSSRGTELLRAGGNAREWIVARSLCVYALIDYSNVPAAKRRGFVEISVRRLAPFPDPECHVVWAPTAAMTWIWPRSRTLTEEAGVPPRGDEDGLSVESVFLGRTEAEGLFLQRTCDGFEGRVWRDNVLLQSRWWPESPALEEWRDFCRGAGLQVPDHVPEPAPYQMHDRPWADSRQRNALARLRQLQRPAAMAAALVLAGALAWQVGGLVRLGVARAAVARETDALGVKLGAILAARDHALADAAAADQLLGLRPAVREITLMARMSRLLADSGATVLDWSVPERGNLALSLRMERPDPEALVKLVQSSGLLTDVSVDGASGGGELVVHGRLPPRNQEAKP